jgi:hypothetical protein
MLISDYLASGALSKDVSRTGRGTTDDLLLCNETYFLHVSKVGRVSGSKNNGNWKCES